jgi:predicted secreted protein
MKRQLGVVIIFVLVLSVVFLAESAVADDSQCRVITRVGSTFKIEMTVCVDGGYSWNLVGQSGKARVELESVDFVLQYPLRCGSPVTQVFTFKAVRKGITRLIFESKRPRESTADKTATWTVVVMPRHARRSPKRP